MSAAFVLASSQNYYPEPEEILMASLFQQYERVLVETIVTTFGLDFLVKDQHGGDVDTIHNVRQIGKPNSQMKYKNAKNEAVYNARGHASDYKYRQGNEVYDAYSDNIKVLHSQGTLIDDYTGNLIGKDRIPSIDHVLSVDYIHNDAGRILAGLSGVDLANQHWNYKVTTKNINSSMRNATVSEYVDRIKRNRAELDALNLKENLTENQLKRKKSLEHLITVDVKKLSNATKEAKAQYEKELKKYYLSNEFRSDLLTAAKDVGLKMGIRQVLGFIFIEVWLTVREEFSKISSPFDFEKILTAIGNGIKRGFENVKNKYKELIAKFGEGAISGALSSITTTICNIFFTTAKNTVKIIRRTYVSLVQAAEILFINPENYLFGDRIREVAKILATAASVAVGTILTDQLEKTGLASIPGVGNILPEFCGAFATGIMTCTFLFYFDRSELMNNLVSKLNNNIQTISSEVNYFKEQALIFEKYAAELMKIDIETFEKECRLYHSFAEKLTISRTQEEVNFYLKVYYDKLNIQIPWQGNFDTFMGNKNNILRFE